MRGAHDNPGGVRVPNLIGDRVKIAVMGSVLGLAVLAYFWPNRAGPPPNKPANNPPPIVDLAPFELDQTILDKIKDTTQLERNDDPTLGADGPRRDRSPWAHLLEKSYNIGPAVAAALHLPAISADIAALRAAPAQHRGRYLWVKGILEEFDEGSVHPIPRARSYKGRLRTADGDHVVFWVSKPLPEGVVAGKDHWVRVEGFFMKIWDEYRVSKADILNAPVIIGPRIDEAYPDWQAVDKLDLTVVRRIRNAVYAPDTQTWTNAAHMATMLRESEDVPLWHVAGYAIRKFEEAKATGSRHENIFELHEHYKKFRHGEYQQGSPFRIRGTFQTRRTFHASANPVGIKYWTEVWLQIPRVSGKLIPIWIPRDIGDWKYGESMDVNGFFLKNYGYTPLEGRPRHTPLFVAGGVERFKMVSHWITKWAGLAFSIFVFFVAAVFFSMNRRARQESADYKERIVERRRQRRGHPRVS